MSLSNSIPNTYTGTTIVHEGVLDVWSGNDGVTAIPGTLIIGDETGNAAFVLRSSNRIADTADIIINKAGTFSLDRVDETVGSLTISGGQVGVNTTDQASATLTVKGNIATNASDVTATINGRLSLGGETRTLTVADGSAIGDLSIVGTVTDGGLNKAGDGQLFLSGSNTYTGPTAVNAGMLVLDGSIADGPSTVDVAVANGATLSGIGTVGGTVDASGTIAPGISIGRLYTGSVTLNSSANLNIELYGTTVETEYDQLDVTGAVALSGAALNVVLGYTPANGDSFTIISNDGSDPVSGAFTVDGNTVAEGASFMVGGNRFVITYAGGSDNNDVVLTVQNITTEIALTAENLVITDVAAGGQDDTLTIKSDTTNNVFIVSDPNRIVGARGDRWRFGQRGPAHG